MMLSSEKSMVSKGDFIKVEYTGKLKENGLIFDTTDEKTAKKAGMSEKKYQPITLIVGAGYTLRGLDSSFEGKELNKEYHVSIKPENGFGLRNSKMIKLIPTRVFQKSQIMPVPGLPVEIDRSMGIIRSVSGGRVIVDFNHPFAGKELEYDFKIVELVKDSTEKVKSLLSFHIGVDSSEIKVEADGKKIKIKMEKPMIKPILEMLEKEIKKYISELNESVFEWDAPDLYEMMKKNKGNKAETKE